MRACHLSITQSSPTILGEGHVIKSLSDCIICMSQPENFICMGEKIASNVQNKLGKLNTFFEKT